MAIAPHPDERESVFGSTELLDWIRQNVLKLSQDRIVEPLMQRLMQVSPDPPAGFDELPSRFNRPGYAPRPSAPSRIKYNPQGFGKTVELEGGSSDDSLLGGTGGDLVSYLTADKGRDSVTGMTAPFQQAFSTMLSSAPPTVQQELSIFSGYRSPERQAQLFDAAVRKYGSVSAARKWVAPPGNSQHNKGNAADLRFASDATKAWVHQNAAQFGLGFPLGHEPWHIELASARGGPAARTAGPVAPPVGNAPRAGSPMAPSATQGPFAGATGRTLAPATAPGAGLSSPMVPPSEPVTQTPSAGTGLGAMIAGLGDALAGGGGGGVAAAPMAGADIQESGPLAASGLANQSLMDSRALQDSLLPVAEEVSTSARPMRLTSPSPATTGPFAQPFQPFRSRPGVAPLDGGIRLRA